MSWDFPIQYVDEIVLKKHFAPMTPDALRACLKWQAMMEEHLVSGTAPPPHELLLVGIPRGSIRAAELVGLDERETFVAFKVLERSERLVDVAAFNCMRLMALPGKDCEWWFDRSTDKNLPADQQRLYLRFSRREGIWGLRILADAQKGEVIRQQATKSFGLFGSHRDLRLRNLFRTSRTSEVKRGKKLRDTYKGREAAIRACLKGFDPEYHRISRNDYEKLLRLSFVLLDRLHAGEVEDRRKHHE